MAHDIEEQQKLSVTFRKRLASDNKAFVTKIDGDLRSEAFEVQRNLAVRVKTLEEENEVFRQDLAGKERDLEMMNETIKREYADFSKNRKRLKTDFNMATNKTHDQFTGIEDLLNSVAH